MAVGGVVGDFADLERLIARLGVVQTKAFRTGLARNLGQEGQSQIAEGFRRGRAPDGTPWKPSRRAIQEGGKTLIKSARLRNAWAGRASMTNVNESGFTLVNRTKYARLHQFGAVIKAKPGKKLRFKVGNRWVYAKKVTIPARPMIPNGPGLGPIWQPAFKAAGEAYILAAFHRGTP